MKIWIDIESGTYGNYENIVVVDVSDWSNEEFVSLSEMSDDERSEFAHELNHIQNIMK